MITRGNNYVVGATASPPEWPCLICGDGYAWHPEAPRRRCYCGVTPAPAALVARVFSGRPIERVLAFRALLLGGPETGGIAYPGTRATIFPSDCSGCGGNHSVAAGQWTRAAKSIHPGAVEALLDADPPLRRLHDIDLPEERQRRARDVRVRVPGLPVRETDQKTLLAQIAWACEIKRRRERGDDALDGSNTSDTE